MQHKTLLNIALALALFGLLAAVSGCEVHPVATNDSKSVSVTKKIPF